MDAKGFSEFVWFLGLWFGRAYVERLEYKRRQGIWGNNLYPSCEAHKTQQDLKMQYPFKKKKRMSKDYNAKRTLEYVPFDVVAFDAINGKL